MNFLLDSNIVIDLLEKGKMFPDEINDSSNLGISILTYYEVKYGILKSGKKFDLDEFIEDFDLHVLSLDVDEISIALDIKIKLGKLGQKLDMVDILIASTAIANKYQLITRDKKHFTRIKDLGLLGIFPYD